MISKCSILSFVAFLAVCRCYIIEGAPSALPQPFMDPQQNTGYGFDYKEYIKRHTQGAPIMIYTLNDCIPCRNTKSLLQQWYPDVPAYFMELTMNLQRPWERRLERDLLEVTGQNTFPYIFVCGKFIGGSSDLMNMHNFGRLRPTVNSCPAKGFFRPNL
ncbi:unnamed protein product, partial [Mesorhabditis belari]|uniref:Glutaredoxin domain-containing protein n=1 Tax=Mesorhabditis belari TaxID=2138241 RepID=A0AAF3EDB2_9BILA